MRRTLIRVLIATCLTGGAFMASSTAAQAYDDWPCLGERYHPLPNTTVQTCPDWAPGNTIPVHKDPNPNSQRVGSIHAPGADWYICQAEGAGYGLIVGGRHYTNYWWAQTYADNLQKGWVNEVYFRGGDNNEEDRKLRFC